jgi:hypothetical protein
MPKIITEASTETSLENFVPAQIVLQEMPSLPEFSGLDNYIQV